MDLLLTLMAFTSTASAQPLNLRQQICADADDVKYLKVNRGSLGVDADAVMSKRYGAAVDLGVVVRP